MIDEVWTYANHFAWNQCERLKLIALFFEHSEKIKKIDECFEAGEIVEKITNNLSPEDWPILYYLINYFKSLGLIQFELRQLNIPIIKVIKISDDSKNTLRTYSGNSKYIFNAYTYFKVEDKYLSIESPLTAYKIILEDISYLPFIIAFLKPNIPSEVCQREFDSKQFLLHKIFEQFVYTNIFINSEQDIPKEKKVWEWHDLIFHQITRFNRFDRSYGGTYRLKSLRTAEPAVKQVNWPLAKKLSVPHAGYLESFSLEYVLNNRQSHPKNKKNSISLKQLENLLFSSARIINKTPKDDKHLYETTTRPYPGAGASYELEIYLIITSCESLENGLYYYHPENHELYFVPDKQQNYLKIAGSITAAMGQRDYPPVCILLSARFLRILWKYESIAYNLILKDVGVLLNTFVMVASALNLWACPIGRSNAVDFEKITHFDPLVEGTVGELAIGSLG